MAKSPSSIGMSEDASIEFRPRVRTFTESSIGSFSSYLLPSEKEALRYQSSSPFYSSRTRPVTPTSVEKTFTSRLSREEELEHDLEEAKWERAEALESLRQLAQGMRIVTRQIKQAHTRADEPSHEDDGEQEVHSATLKLVNSSSSISRQLDTNEESSFEGHNSCTSSIQTFVSDYDRQITNLSHSLDCADGAGADLLSLSHAASMVVENVRMVSQEASDLVQDVQTAQQEVQTAKECVTRAQRAAKKLYKENQSLQQEVETLRAEKKVLVKEVKALHSKRAAEEEDSHRSYRDGMLRLMEQYVAGALQVHEQQLAKSNKDAESIASLDRDDLTKDFQEDYIAPDLSASDSTSDQSEASEDKTNEKSSSTNNEPVVKKTAEAKEENEKKTTKSTKPKEEKDEPVGLGGFDFGKFAKKITTSLTSDGDNEGRSSHLSWYMDDMPRKPKEIPKKSSRQTAPNKDKPQTKKQTSSKKEPATRRKVPAKNTTSKAPKEPHEPAVYKPLTFSTLTNTKETESSSLDDPDKKDEHDLGARMMNFFHKQPEPKTEKRCSLLDINELDGDDDDTTSIQQRAVLESRSPFDSPAGEKVERHNPSPTAQLLPRDIAFQETSDYLMSPYSEEFSPTMDARSVDVSFESKLLRSLAVPPSTAPLHMKPRPAVAGEHGLYER